MAWSEHVGGNKYKIVERDPSRAKRPKRSITVIMPAEIADSRSEKKRIAWLSQQEDEWSELVISGKYQDKGKKRSRKNKRTLSDFIPTWEKVFGLQKYTGETYQNTMHILNTKVVPRFGDMWIDEITTLELAEWFASLVNSKTGEALSTNYKLNIYKAVKSVFDKAHEWKVIETNPMDGLSRPSANKKEKKKMRDVKQNYTKAEAAELLLAMYELPKRWRLYFTGVMLGGFRRGEFLAVEWDDMDYERSAIFIEAQITVDHDRQKIEGEVKTIESEGWVPMPRWYMAELKEYELEWKKEKLRCKEWLNEEGKSYVFHSGKGIMYYPTTPTNTWAKFLDRNNFPHVKLHGLRHTAATLLREHGADQRSVQKFLRHAKLETTNRYTHEVESVNRSLIDPLEAMNPRGRRFAP